MKIAAYTSVNAAYLTVARIIAKSVKKHHPEWDFILLFNDSTPDNICWEDEPFDKVVFSEWLNVETDWRKWAYGYSVIEFCTATKGVMGEYLFDKMGYDALVYLDPDTVVFSRLEEVVDILKSEKADVILTPHITDREYDDEAVHSHEMAALKHGTFNLGFYAIANRKHGREYLRWWSERLLKYAQIDFNKGLFTDQKWCNLAPYLFEGIEVLVDRAYNTATWNMTNRQIELSNDGEWQVNGKPLRFYHFSGFGNDFAWADKELARFGAKMDGLRALWSLYKELYKENYISEKMDWKWGTTSYGKNINNEMRKIMAEKNILNPYDEVF